MVSFFARPSFRRRAVLFYPFDFKKERKTKNEENIIFDSYGDYDTLYRIL